jgi:hypothetical protein
MSTLGKDCPIRQNVKCNENCAWLTVIIKKPEIVKSCALYSMAEDLYSVLEKMKDTSF